MISTVCAALLIQQVLAHSSAAPQSATGGGSPQSSGYGYGGGGSGGGSGGGNGGQPGAVPPGVGYNNPGGEVSRQDAENAALSSEYQMHMVGPTAAQGVGSGGGPPISDGRTPGYVQAKFVTPYGNSVVMHHYGPGYPPPMGTGGGPNDGNGGGGVSNGTVAGNPGLVNWGTMSAWDREELGNGAWVGTPSSSNPMPYIGGFND